MEILNPIRVKKFWEKVNKDGPLWEYAPDNLLDELKNCWVWLGAKDKDGYGNFTVSKGKTGKAHRYSFLLRWGWLLPHPYQVDHKCTNPSCVNPYHLLCIHGKTNNEISNSPSAINKRKYQCKNGHLYSRENTRLEQGRRICKQCEKEKVGYEPR